MKRARPKATPTDVFAKRIAQAIGKDRPLPPLAAELEQYCDSAPREIFTAFAGVARHLPPAGNDEELAAGYLIVLQTLLTTLRYRAERGHADADALIAEFQADIAGKIRAGKVDPAALAFVSNALHQARIPGSPELAAAVAEHAPPDDDGDGASVDDFSDAFDEMIEACSSDPFTAVSSLIEGSHIMPVEARGALVEALALAGSAPTRSTAVLFLLDQVLTVRRATASVLGEVATSLNPTDVRRLIAMRNWRPESERAEIDAIIRKARTAGIECAQWDEGGAASIVATAIDGAATQAFLLSTPSGRKARLSSVLAKGGIADAWSTEPEPRRQIERQMADAGRDAPMLAVSRSYLDRIVEHHLALGLQYGVVPSTGLLQVAETIGGASWQPSIISFDKALAGLIAELPKAMRQPAAVTSTLLRSDELVDLETIAQSWFEDGPEIARAVERAPAANRKALATYLLQTVFTRHRQRWAEIILHTALWMHEAPSAGDLCWPDLAIVAQALGEGRDMTEIGLMRDIAMRTVGVLRDAQPL